MDIEGIVEVCNMVEIKSQRYRVDDGPGPTGIQLKPIAPEDLDPNEWQATDDVNGGNPLDIGEVRKPRNGEMQYVKNIGVYSYDSKKVAAKKGMRVIKTRWVDADNGDRHRSRLCAMEFRSIKEGS